MEIEYKKPGRQNWERHNGVGVYNHVVGLLEGNPELEFVSLTFRTTGQYDYRRKPQPRYVTKKVQEVRVGDVVKAGSSWRGGTVEEVRLRSYTTMLVYTVSQENFGNSLYLEVEVRD